jgi:hypothetical protein
MRKYRFYKEGLNWYIDLPEWTGSKADLEMVAGADNMLDYMAEGGDEVHAFISEEEFEGADLLHLKSLAEDIGNGAYYLMKKYKGIDIDLTMWLCDVTLFVFNNKFPEKIYICKIDND